MEKVVMERATRTRHIVLWLVVLMYMNTYMDRVVISVAAPSMQEDLGFDAVTMGWIFAAFQISYAMFQIPGGWMGDRFGPRKTLAGITAYWSIFTAGTAFMWSASSMIVCRFLFGAGEAGAFPIATRALSRWMLPAERGWAQGVTHAGARLSAALTPPLVVVIIAFWNWQAAFVIFAILGWLWAAVWYWYYRDDPREHESVNVAELEKLEHALGRATTVKKIVPWKQILSNPQMWLISSMYFCYGYGIVTFLTWFPTYLIQARDFTLAEMGLYASAPLAAGVIGNLVGGYFSDHLIKRTNNLKFARRVVAIFGFVIAGVMVPFASSAPDPLISVLFFAIAVFGLEITVGVSWAVTLDVGKEYAGSVASVMNTFGNIAGAIAAAATGYIVTYADWNLAFTILGVLSLFAAVLFLKIDASKTLFVEKL
jgi:sugar phosphate permease